jgi:hypothetical protein
MYGQGLCQIRTYEATFSLSTARGVIEDNDELYVLFDLVVSPSETFMGLLHTPQTPRLDFRGMPPAGFRVGSGPYTAEKQACKRRFMNGF